jgi:hypothetical protein
LADEGTEAVKTLRSSYGDMKCAGTCPSVRSALDKHTDKEGAQYARQHEGGGCDICRECKTGPCNHGILERSCIDWVVVGPNLRKGQCKGRNYPGVSRELVETKTVPIHTANAHEEDKWNNHYREPSPPYSIGSPNDNRVT